MPAIDQNQKPTRKKRAVKRSTAPGPVPDNQDRTRANANAPVVSAPPVKVRMYAHPDRLTAQNTARTVRTEQVQRERAAQTARKARKAHRTAVKRAVKKIHTTPVP